MNIHKKNRFIKDEIGWSLEAQDEALSKGWYLLLSTNRDLMIKATTTGRFKSDQAAFEHVAEQAAKGERVAILALTCIAAWEIIDTGITEDHQ